MTEQPEKLDLQSQDISEDKRQELLRLFPEIRTEGGQIDFERLKLALGEAVDVGKERFGLNWPGKADCFKTIQAPSLGTLRPSPEESINFDTTENLIIEGDNLEGLKLLQKSYLGQVKMIYLDPPYNTGNDFIYPDKYTESLQTYLEYTGQVDAHGKKFGTNTEADGRFHSKWLTMMYPRLFMSRNLLCEDGVIFVSIDDHEVHNLRHLMDEIFGSDNFIANIIWNKVFASKASAQYFSESHDHILVYARMNGAWKRNLMPRTEEQEADYKNPDDDPRGLWRSVSLSARNPYSEGLWGTTSPGGRIIEGPPPGRYWAISKDNFDKLCADNRIWWGSDGNGIPRRKLFLSEVQSGIVPTTIWHHKDVGSTQDAKKELLKRVSFSSPEQVFDTPKPTSLIKRMLEISTSPNSKDLVMDFFAGSGTAGDAVLQLNSADGGNRRFILIQLPERVGQDDSLTIADMTKERVRRAIKQLKDEDAGKLDLNGASKQDRGFRVFKLAESNFKPWNAEVPHEAKALQHALDLHVNHIREDRTANDILYEILLKSGFPLCTPVETQTLTGKPVYSVAGGALFICLERALTLELIRAMAEQKPERVVCLDEGFAGNDQLKANAVQIFKTKGVTSFRTV